MARAEGQHHAAGRRAHRLRRRAGGEHVDFSAKKRLEQNNKGKVLYPMSARDGWVSLSSVSELTRRRPSGASRPAGAQVEVMAPRAPARSTRAPTRRCSSGAQSGRGARRQAESSAAISRKRRSRTRCCVRRGGAGGADGGRPGEDHDAQQRDQRARGGTRREERRPREALAPVAGGWLYLKTLERIEKKERRLDFGGGGQEGGGRHDDVMRSTRPTSRLNSPRPCGSWRTRTRPSRG